MSVVELIPFSASTTTVLALGAFAAGFVTGLIGFGTALVALAFWLHVVDPHVTGPLIAICAVASQLTSIRLIWRGLQWRRLWPFLGGGVVGLPIGVWLLELVHADMLKVLVGLVLVAYALYNLIHGRIHIPRWGGARANTAVGALGGILGGAAGLAGVLPTVWCGMRGWSADEQRGTYQPYTLAILALAIPGYAMNGALTAEVFAASIFAIPLSWLAGWAGVHCYALLDARQFRLMVLWMLLVSGALLLLA
ncbi:MAG: putative membrane protein YfcA [Gammaproteobacteria bacterium]